MLKPTQHGPLIGLTGRPGAGKDEAALVLVRAGYKSIAFADALRIEIAQAWGVDMGLFSKRSTKEAATPQLQVNWCMNVKFHAWANHMGHDIFCPRSPRWAMQTWGTWRRHINPAHWVQYVETWVRTHRANGSSGLVITDVRLPNEAAMLRAFGGQLLRVHRPGLPALAADTAQHESERHLQLASDGEIHNDGDLQHLQAEVWRAVNALQAGAGQHAQGQTP